MSRRDGRLTMILAGVLAAAILAGWRIPASPRIQAHAAPPNKKAKMDETERLMERLAPLFDPLPKPEEGDWLAKYHEKGQSYRKYRSKRRQPIRDQFSEIHLLPLGEFTDAQEKLLARTGEFMELFFGMKVKVFDRLPLENVPQRAQRPRDEGKNRQLLTTYLLQDVLKPRRSDDAAALLGFTAEDLWPGEGWNYVFGQASLQERIGVWSLFRNGDPDGDADEARLCLLRTLKTAVHETGHMLGFPHCIAYSCGMNGANHRAESDRQPLEFCPECQAKLWWTCRVDPVARYRGLIEFVDDAGLAREAELWREMSAALSDAK